jgi:hypothetical protein
MKLPARLLHLTGGLLVARAVVASSNDGCPGGNISLVQNGVCDALNNVEGCSFDGGDCCCSTGGDYSTVDCLDPGVADKDADKRRCYEWSSSGGSGTNVVYDIYLPCLLFLWSMFWLCAAAIHIGCTGQYPFKENMRSWSTDISKENPNGMKVAYVLKCVRKTTVEKLSAFLRMWQMSGVAFVAAVYWVRDDPAVAWVPSVMTFLLSPLVTFLPAAVHREVSVYAVSFWTAFGAAFLPLCFGAFAFFDKPVRRDGRMRWGRSTKLWRSSGDLLFNTMFLSVLSTLLSPWSCKYVDAAVAPGERLSLSSSSLLFALN